MSKNLNIRVTAFDRGKYTEALRILEARKAPNYILEAYHLGHSNVINAYYKDKLQTKLGRASTLEENTREDFLEKAKRDKHRRFIQEAKKKNDMAFIKLFYQVTGMDILTGSKLPPSAGKLMKQVPTKGLGTTNILRRK